MRPRRARFHPESEARPSPHRERFAGRSEPLQYRPQRRGEPSVRRGAPVLGRSVFDRVPGAGRWSTALLLDGNLGIGGHPEALLGRVTSLLEAGGTVLVELESPGSTPRVQVVRFDVDGVEGPWFAWTPVGAEELLAPATAAGLRVEDVWPAGDRWFGALRRD